MKALVIFTKKIINIVSKHYGFSGFTSWVLLSFDKYEDEVMLSLLGELWFEVSLPGGGVGGFIEVSVLCLQERLRRALNEERPSTVLFVCPTAMEYDGGGSRWKNSSSISSGRDM